LWAVLEQGSRPNDADVCAIGQEISHRIRYGYLANCGIKDPQDDASPLFQEGAHMPRPYTGGDAALGLSQGAAADGASDLV
jgi:hypothetical protein